MRFSPENSPARPSAFTLVELLVVLAIIAILAILTTVSVSAMMQRARQATCISRLKNLVMVAHNLKNDNDGKFRWIRYVSWSPAVQNSATERPLSMKDADIRDFTGPNPTNSSHVGEGLLCPAAKVNRKQWIWNDRWWPHYRPNDQYARNSMPLFKASDAMLFYDVAWANWNPDTFAHFPGINPVVNVGYADGHVGTLTLQDFKRLFPGSEESAPFYRNGWVQESIP